MWALITPYAPGVRPIRVSNTWLVGEDQISSGYCQQRNRTLAIEGAVDPDEAELAHAVDDGSTLIWLCV